MIWFTADQHFMHENIIEYCNRPFHRIGKMNNTIIANYRKCVSPEDTCYFLGDLTILGPQHKHAVEHIVMQLPGRKILILGNHDKFNPFVYMDIGFESVHTTLEVEEFILVHDPALSVVRDDKRWLCGHVHTVFRMGKKGDLLNIGVDQWGFFPVSIDEVRRTFEEKEDI